MALNNSQYDEIFRSYDAKQLKAQHQLEERTKAAYERSPELKALDASIAEISVASARRLLDGDSSALTELKAELKNLRTRKKALMKELSLSRKTISSRFMSVRTVKIQAISMVNHATASNSRRSIGSIPSPILRTFLQGRISVRCLWIIIQIPTSTLRQDLHPLPLPKPRLQDAMNL